MDYPVLSTIPPRPRMATNPIQPPQQTKIKQYPLLAWLVPDWKGKNDHKAHTLKNTECRPNDQLWQRPQMQHTALTPTVPAGRY